MSEVGAFESANPAATIGMLSRLPRGHAGLAAYYRGLLDSNDEVLRIGAMCALIDGKAFSDDVLSKAVAFSSHGAVRGRIFPLLMDQGMVARAREVLAVPFDAGDTFAEDRLRLLFDNDEAGLAALEGRQFLRDGNLQHLRNAMVHAEAAGGWRAALPWTIRAMMLMPMDGGLAFVLLQLLNDANELELLKTVFRLFGQANLFPTTGAIFDATLQLRAGEAQKALRILDDFRQPAPIANVQAFIEQLRAKAAEALGKYREAYASHVKMNEVRRNSSVDPESYFHGIRRSEACRFQPLMRDPRSGWVTILGFARSGTTLLENMLGAHADIETIEEKPSLPLAAGFVLARTKGDVDRSLGLAARQLYYDDLDRYRVKSAARIVVDKGPMNSAYAGLLANLFPEKRHIFVIRDPRDVVMSCFKQDFSINPAMENLRSIAGACRLYDFVMSRWFTYFTLDDERVCYTRYDTFVTDFENEARRILAFLRTDWDPAVLSFSDAAQSRQALTPSYQKVRQGLRIGVQTEWRNYRFLFEAPEAKPIKKWVDFFGYPID